jgi:hypothetical protein
VTENAPQTRCICFSFVFPLLRQQRECLYIMCLATLCENKLCSNRMYWCALFHTVDADQIPCLYSVVYHQWQYVWSVDTLCSMNKHVWAPSLYMASKPIQSNSMVSICFEVKQAKAGPFCLIPMLILCE